MIRQMLRTLKYKGATYNHNNKSSLTLRPSSKPRIIMMDTASYVNLGDQAISYAQASFLERLFPDTEIIDITDNRTLGAINKLKKLITSQDIIVLVGGGNFGNLYLSTEYIRQTIIREFKNNKIVLFPQSIFFTNDKLGEQELQHAKRIYGSHKNLTLTAREPRTYNIMRKEFSKNRIIEVPDIVFSLDLGSRYEGKRRDGIVALLRNDEEVTEVSTKFLNLIPQLEKKGLTISISDTAIRKEKDKIIDDVNREKIIFEKFDEIAGYRVAITDRLHGMIFAYITQTPCIVLPNNNYKIKETYNKYLKSCNYIKFLEDIELDELQELILDLEKVDPTPVDFSKLYKPLVNEFIK